MDPISKSPIFSKTVLFNLVVAFAAFFPHVSEWISQNTPAVMGIIGAVGVLLRFVTNSKISWDA